MSTTTTTTTAAAAVPLPSQSSHTLITDYQRTHTQENALDNPQHPKPSTPSNWPTAEHRRVPAYRPVNTELDQRKQSAYLKGTERAFIAIIFTGVFLQAAVSNVWRNSLGRIWDVRYDLGGEW